MNVIEHLAQDGEWMFRFCKDCRADKECPADHNPFFDAGCIRDNKLLPIEEAVEELEKLMEEAVA